MSVAEKRSWSNSPTYSDACRESFKFNGKRRTIYRNCVRSVIPYRVHKALLGVAFLNLAVAEQHGVTFDNQCGIGKPIITEGGSVISDGNNSYTNSSSLWAGRAFLQTGSCGSNGEGCTVVEMTLINPTSTVDISLIPPMEFTVPVSYSFSGGCDGKGESCTSATCTAASHFPSDPQAIFSTCKSNDTNLIITFCPSNSIVNPKFLTRGSVNTSRADVSTSSTITSSSSLTLPMTPSKSSTILSALGTITPASSSASVQTSFSLSSSIFNTTVVSTSNVPSKPTLPTTSTTLPNMEPRSPDLKVLEIVGTVGGSILIFIIGVLILTYHRKRSRGALDTSHTPIPFPLPRIASIILPSTVISKAHHKGDSHTVNSPSRFSTRGGILGQKSRIGEEDINEDPPPEYSTSTELYRRRALSF